MQRNPEAWVADYARDGYPVAQDRVDAKTPQCLRDGLEPILADPDVLRGELRRHVQMERNYLQLQRRAGDPDQVGNAVRLVMELPLFAGTYRGLHPRSTDPARQRQLRMALR